MLLWVVWWVNGLVLSNPEVSSPLQIPTPVISFQNFRPPAEKFFQPTLTSLKAFKFTHLLRIRPNLNLRHMFPFLPFLIHPLTNFLLKLAIKGRPPWNLPLFVHRFEPPSNPQRQDIVFCLGFFHAMQHRLQILSLIRRWGSLLSTLHCIYDSFSFRRV